MVPPPGKPPMTRTATRTRYLTAQVPFTGMVTVRIAVPADEWVDDTAFLNAADDVLNASTVPTYRAFHRGVVDGISGDAEDLVPTGEVTIIENIVSG